MAVIKALKTLIIFTLLLCLAPAPGRAGNPSWAYSAPQGQAMGAVALVIAVANTSQPGPPPVLDAIRFYACPLPDCTSNPVEMDLIVPSEVDGPWRLYWVFASLPVGEYRLAAARGKVMALNRPFDFSMNLNLGFKVRAARCAYLGRLTAVLKEKPAYRPKAPVALSGWAVTKATGRKNVPDLTYDRTVSDMFATDATKITRLWPDRVFLPMERDLLE